MVEGRLKSGEHMLIARIEHYVKLRDFANHLAEHYYDIDLEFPDKLSKKEAEKILRRGLFFDGLNGSYADDFFQASFEDSEIFGKIFSKAVSWVKENYKWLS